MELTQISGGDCGRDDCPTVFMTDRDTIAVQGYLVGNEWQLCEPSVMAVQIDRLASLSQLPNVRIGVLPLSVRVRDGAYHTFVTYDRRLVTIELFTGQLVLRDRE